MGITSYNLWIYVVGNLNTGGYKLLTIDYPVISIVNLTFEWLIGLSGNIHCQSNVRGVNWSIQPCSLSKVLNIAIHNYLFIEWGYRCVLCCAYIIVPHPTIIVCSWKVHTNLLLHWNFFFFIIIIGFFFSLIFA